MEVIKGLIDDLSTIENIARSEICWRVQREGSVSSCRS